MTAPNKTHGFTFEQLEWMCQRKHRWPDELSARAGAMQALEARPETKKLFTYQCPACRGWHLTKKFVQGVEPVLAERSAA